MINSLSKNRGAAALLNFGKDSIPDAEKDNTLIQQNYTKEEIQIEMRDGVKLFTSIYAPRDKSISYPILITRMPFNSEPDKDRYSKWPSWFPHLLKEKYILVFQDVRGKYMSEGEYVAVRPYNPNKKNKETDENSDAYDTIDWLVHNVDNNNGNVGVFGISAMGFYATMTLPNAHPALKAVSPQVPVTDTFLGDDFHHNGAFFLMDSFSKAASMGTPKNGPTRLNSKISFDYKNKDNYAFYKELGPIKNMQQKLPVPTNKFWSNLIKHPNYDSFWKARNVLPHLKNVAPAVLVVGGWFDAEDLYGPLKTYEAIEKQNKTVENKLIMGPWSHGQWIGNEGKKLGNINFDSNTQAYFRDVELKFFNYHLKNKGEMDLPEASIFITGANEWKAFNAWPPLNIEKKELFLDCDEKLSFSKPSATACYDEYAVDPNKPVPYAEGIHQKRTKEYMTDDQRFASRRPDVMVYQTAILEKDITVVGALNVNLFVSTTGTDADYVVKMIDVFPNELENDEQNDTDITMAGYQMLVRGDVMRGKFRNSFENPEPFTPGQVTEVSFEMLATAHQFKKGHRIMIQVQNSWFPLVDINPQSFVNIYEADEKDFIKATHRIYHDAEHASKISISVLKN
ncbi:MAG: putative CocE/NonD family hydrolase [Polaribacter sp.]|jgi:putative CocE/NonD family hydrolase